jgi:glucose dehydrogenase
MKEKRLFWALALLVGMMGFSQKTIPNFVPVTDAQLRNPPAGDWLMYRRTYDGWGYSPLNQINTAIGLVACNGIWMERRYPLDS